MKNTIALLAALITSSTAFAADNSACPSVAETAKSEISKAPENVLKLVATLVAQNEACAGDIVKAAITSTNAKPELVGQIVEAATAAAPKMASQIASYAFAVAPDAKPAIVAALTKISAENGTAQANGTKVSPIEFPGGSIVGFQSLSGPQQNLFWPIPNTGDSAPVVTQ
ncbi:hypothetical protein ACFPK9_09500 [Rubritalea spongiae]|uniref:HEAT repeat domain-containing protein n=1 Tax=Rubritalea spongiae TaxID=430797 RepID=A0ABW5E2N8_9BACT